MQFEHFLFGLLQMEMGFAIVLWLCVSGRRFLKGDVRSLVDKMIFGVIFLHASVAAQFFIEAFGVYGSILEILKYSFMMIGLIFLFWSAHIVSNTSKILGFASEKMPEKLKKVLK